MFGNPYDRHDGVNFCALGVPAAKDERSLITILTQECLKDRNVWLFAITYFFVYVVRQVNPGAPCLSSRSFDKNVDHDHHP